MIKKRSDDPDVEAAAGEAAGIVRQVLASLQKAETFDYGGHELHVGEYNVCSRCTGPIAEAQQARAALIKRAEEISDDVVREHLVIAADLFQAEAEAAQIRAELHNGHGSERILNILLEFMYNRNVHDDYTHSHNQGK